MYDELLERLHKRIALTTAGSPLQDDLKEAADAIEELQTTLCNWCAVCPEDKRDLSTCEIYESCRAKRPKEE